MTIWDTFAHTKGKVEGNENGDVACDHYNLCVRLSTRVCLWSVERGGRVFVCWISAYKQF